MRLPAWGPRLGAARIWIRRYRAYQQLYPLWEALCAATPVVLEAPGVPPARRTAWRDLELGLTRRVIEIEDARLALRRYDDPAVIATSARRGEQAGLSGDDLRIVVEAARLEVALQARRADVAITRVDAPVDEGALPAAAAVEHASGHDVLKVADWLVRVGRAWQSCPLVTEVRRAHVSRSR